MRRVTVGRILGLALIGATCVFSLAVFESRAATLPLARDYLNRQEANLTSGLVHQVFFTAATNLPGSANVVSLTFPDANDGSWCRTAGADLAVSGLINPEGATESATILPGTLTAQCTQGSGSGNFDRLTVNGVGPLNAGTKYGLQLGDGTVAKLGTPAPAIDIAITLATNNGTIDIDTGLIHTAIMANDDVTISAVVASTPPATNPVVEFRGHASSSASLTITRDNLTISTTTVGADATFDVVLAEQPVGQHVYELLADDTNGRNHPTITVATSLATSSTTVISGIFFGPTIAASTNQLTVGDLLTLSGATVPNSTVAMRLNPSNQSFSAPSDASGRWNRTIDTTGLPPGSYTAIATTIISESTVSEESQAISFALSAVDSPPVVKCDGKPTSDVNCDAKVNLVDFSIMLFYWNQTVSADNRSDMNHDGIINIVDFSILLYQWTGF